MIIESLLMLDFYKLSMQQFIMNYYGHVNNVTFKLTNRNKTMNLIGGEIDPKELRRELDHARTLRFTEDELNYLRALNVGQKKLFRSDYIRALGSYSLPEYTLKRKVDENCQSSYELSFTGPWFEVTLWETIAMSILAELYGKKKLSESSTSILDTEQFYARGVTKLHTKINKILPMGAKFIDFGTRRRFSAVWHDKVVSLLRDDERFLGTSNVYLAKKYNLTPMGTNAHELYQGVAGAVIDQNSYISIRASQIKLLEQWEEMYGQAMSIFLPDTFTSKAFFKLLPTNLLARWKGSRQDSGCPYAFANALKDTYIKAGIDHHGKLLIFSDALNMDKIKALYKAYSEDFIVSFGIGTNLTNDLDLDPLNIVVKLDQVMGNKVCKLSDDPGKTMGSVAEKYKEIFNVT